MNQRELSQQDRADLAKLGLKTDAIHLHATRVNLTLGRSSPTTQFPVNDSCRLDNGGILNDAWIHSVGSHDQDLSGFVAFVPAAGAATRYFDALEPLARALLDYDTARIQSSIQELLKRHATHWPLPKPILTILENPSTVSREAAAQGLASLQKPKALLPCVREGETFLELKVREHRALAPLAGEIYITPAGQSAEFAEHISAAKEPLGHARFLEQGNDLCTIRFTTEGHPMRMEDGQLSPVPAGHGALAALLPKARDFYPRAHSLFIRNIDNVMGVGSDAIASTRHFLDSHQRLLYKIQGIRRFLAEGDFDDASAIAETLLDRLPAERMFTAEQQAHVVSLTHKWERTLWKLQYQLFHTPAQLADLIQVYSRPVNTLGMVPNTGKDLGGTPVFAQTTSGVTKVCLELPHVSPQDRAEYFENPRKATHFNPVFLAAEIPESDAPYTDSAHPFWLIAQKTHHGKPALYHETLLFELMGNSHLANCVFVEVPRLVFNPHKVPADGANKKIRDWSR